MGDRLLAQGTPETDDGPLAGDVDRLARVALPSGDRSDEHDVSPPLGLHLWQGGAHGQGRAEHVGLDHRPPARRVAPGDGAGVPDPGVGDDEVDPPEVPAGRPRPGRRSPPRGARRRRRRPPRRPRRPRRQPSSGGGGQVPDHQPGAGPGQEADGHRPDPLPAPGDDPGAAAQGRGGRAPLVGGRTRRQPDDAHRPGNSARRVPNASNSRGPSARRQAGAHGAHGAHGLSRETPNAARGTRGREGRSVRGIQAQRSVEPPISWRRASPRASTVRSGHRRDHGGHCSRPGPSLILAHATETGRRGRRRCGTPRTPRTPSSRACARPGRVWGDALLVLERRPGRGGAAAPGAGPGRRGLRRRHRPPPDRTLAPHRLSDGGVLPAAAPGGRGVRPAGAAGDPVRRGVVPLRLGLRAGGGGQSGAPPPGRSS